MRLLLSLAVAGLALAWRLDPGPPMPVLLLQAARGSSVVDPQAMDARLEPAFQAQLTADDVARGIQALADGRGPGLAAEQRARLLPLAESGREARAAVDQARQRRRALRADERQAGLALATALVDAGWTPREGTP